MVLSNTAIFQALDDGRLIISPEPWPRRSVSDSPKSPFDRTSVDLTLSRFIQRPKENVGASIDFRSGSLANTLNTFFDQQVIDDEQGFVLRRNQFILGQTAESVGLPLPRELDSAAREKAASPAAWRERVHSPASDCSSTSRRRPFTQVSALARSPRAHELRTGSNHPVPRHAHLPTPPGAGRGHPRHAAGPIRHARVRPRIAPTDLPTPADASPDTPPGPTWHPRWRPRPCASSRRSGPRS